MSATAERFGHRYFNGRVQITLEHRDPDDKRLIPRMMRRRYSITVRQAEVLRDQLDHAIGAAKAKNPEGAKVDVRA